MTKKNLHIKETFTALVSKIAQSSYAHLIPCFLIPFGIMLVIYLCHGTYPIADESVLVLDLNGQYVYFYEALREFIYGDTSLLYSFSRALGGEFLGIYAYYIASPLSWLVALFPKGRMLEALLVIFLLKTGLCGITFGWYLHKTSRRVNKIYIRIFATLYALCSYAIVQQHNSMWIDAMIWLPVLTYAIEALIKNKKYKLFVISLVMAVMSNFYIGYMVCLYTALYFFFYYAAHKDNNPMGESFHFVKSLLRIGVWSALAIGISAVMILGAYYSLSFGKNTFSDPNWEFVARFSLADLFVKFLPGAYDTVRPAGLPIVYCGVLTLLLVPFYYLRKDIPIREKLLSTLFIAVFAASFIISPIDIVWHGFQKPNWLNYRYSFMLCFFLLTLAYQGMLGIRKQRATTVFTIGITLLVSVLVLQKFEYENFVLDEYGLELHKIATFRTVWFTIAMLAILCAILSLIIHAKRQRDVRKLSTILLLVICAESFANGLIQMTSLDIDVSYSSYSAYNDYIGTVRIAADKVQEMDTSFYRMEKTRQKKTNDNMALKMRGLSCSTSTLNKETIPFLLSLGYTSYSNRSKYMGETPLADSLLGVRYILSEKTVSETRSDYRENRALDAVMADLYSVYTETEDYIAYQNPYALSIAYTVNDAIKDFNLFTFDEEGDAVMAEASPMTRLNQFVAAMIGESDYQAFIPIKTSVEHENCRKGYAAGHAKYSVSDSSRDASISFTATVPEDAYVFFYAPSDYKRETDLLVNGQKFGDFMASDSNRIKTLGKFAAGESITVTMKLEKDNFYLMDGEYVLYYLDEAQMKYALTLLAEEQFLIEDYTETRLSGTITTSDNGETVLTTIPYDEGWEIYVDGKRTEIFKATNALIAFDIEAKGDHTLEMVYSPRIIRIGFAVSLLSGAAFVAIIVGETVYKRRKAAKNQTETEN